MKLSESAMLIIADKLVTTYETILTFIFMCCRYLLIQIHFFPSLKQSSMWTFISYGSEGHTIILKQFVCYSPEQQAVRLFYGCHLFPLVSFSGFRLILVIIKMVFFLFQINFGIK